MQTLIPQSASAVATPKSKAGRWLGFGLTPLTVLLFATGLLAAIPAFFHPKQIYFMVGWDVLLALLVAADVAMMPKPDVLTVTREFLDSPQLGEATRVELSVRSSADRVLDVRMVDDLHEALVGTPAVQRVEAFPRESAVSATTIYPRERGDFALGKVYLRYRGAFKMVERWAVVEPLMGSAEADPPTAAKDDKKRKQRVRVYPAHEDSRENTEFYLLRGAAD